jgi:hypothetical protein
MIDPKTKIEYITLLIDQIYSDPWALKSWQFQCTIIIEAVIVSINIIKIHFDMNALQKVKNILLADICSAYILIQWYIFSQHVTENNIVILNDGTGFRLNPINLETSSIDLSLVSTLISSHCTWYADQKSTHGSDHFVVNIKISYKPMIYNDHFNSSNSNYKNVDWEGFANACDKKKWLPFVSFRHFVYS